MDTRDAVISRHNKRGYIHLIWPDMNPAFTPRPIYPKEMENCAHRPTEIYRDETLHICKCSKCKYTYEVNN